MLNQTKFFRSYNAGHEEKKYYDGQNNTSSKIQSNKAFERKLELRKFANVKCVISFLWSNSCSNSTIKASKQWLQTTIF